MHVEDVHEDRNLHARFARLWVFSLFNLADLTVHRAHDGAGVFRRFARGIAEKLQRKKEEDEDQEGDDAEIQPPAHEKENKGAGQDGPAFAGNDRMRIDAGVQVRSPRENLGDSLF